MRHTLGFRKRHSGGISGNPGQPTGMQGARFGPKVAVSGVTRRLPLGLNLLISMRLRGIRGMGTLGQTAQICRMERP